MGTLEHSVFPWLCLQLLSSVQLLKIKNGGGRIAKKDKEEKEKETMRDGY